MLQNIKEWKHNKGRIIKIGKFVCKLPSSPLTFKIFQNSKGPQMCYFIIWIYTEEQLLARSESTIYIKLYFEKKKKNKLQVA